MKNQYRNALLESFALCLVLLFSFSISAHAGTDVAGSPDGLPCPGGGQDYRDHMVGHWPPRVDRIGEDTRPYAGFDFGWYMQCTDPSSAKALQTVLDAVNSDPLMTQCNGTKLTIDDKGNVPLCGNDSDSYVGVVNGEWTWDYYNPGNGGTTDAGDGSTVPNPSSDGVTALAGKNPGLASDPSKRLWLVVAEDGGKIKGQLMTDTNKPSGSALTIGGSDAHTPKVAFGTGINKYLVTWVSGSTLWGQMLTEDGSASGGAFKIGTGGAVVYPASNIQYDSRNQRFILTYEKKGSSLEAMIAIVNSSGAVTGPSVLGSVSNSDSNPSIAVNLKTGASCVTYTDGDKLQIQPVGADGTPGTATQLAQTTTNVGIIYNQSDGTYLAAWTEDGAVKSKSLVQCAPDDNTTPATLASGTLAATLIPARNGFGLFAVLESGTEDHFYIFDSSGNQMNEQAIFAGTWDTTAFWLAGASNPITGVYAAVASPDAKTVKFTANVGTEFSGPINNGPIPPSTDNPVPSNGLPTNLAQMIEALFSWSLSIIGLVIFVRFFYAGFLWFTSAGDTGRISDAQKIMKNAAYGAAVLFSAFLILNTINPDLVHSTFNMPGIPATLPAGSTNTQPSGSSVKLYTCNQNDQCVLDPQGQYDNANCDTACNPPASNNSVKLYTCNENGQCVQDPQGQYDDSNCYQTCSSN